MIVCILTTDTTHLSHVAVVNEHNSTRADTICCIISIENRWQSCASIQSIDSFSQKDVPPLLLFPKELIYLII